MRKGSLVKYRPTQETVLKNNLTDEYSFGIVLESYFLHHTIGGLAVEVNEYVVYDMKYGMKFCLSDDIFEVEEINGNKRIQCRSKVQRCIG